MADSVDNLVDMPPTMFREIMLRTIRHLRDNNPSGYGMFAAAFAKEALMVMVPPTTPAPEGGE